ncbi:hypothetical protein AVDCRST_MAG94-3116 [uncultured Leptolyngbya sp.]|uniref:Uncharacterized protein n=1 Tax=uncultured Leptolyngbya sp. TaxID=332963 RepID=A0A6J4MG13_9CYAN|nr:hypothetical protein AVDCRST_MAG94-3116 [uncultured Leptolyngbya sp.]
MESHWVLPQVASIAPSAFKVVTSASVNPIAPVMSMPS